MELDLTGQFRVRILRDGLPIFEDFFHNGIVDEAKNALLDTMFNAETQATWYCGLMASSTVLSASDTMASHAGWTEYTNYDEAARIEWPADDAASKVVKNTTYIEFTINDTTDPTIPGIFICSESTKDGTTGVLWCTANFTSAPTVANGEIIQVQYILTVN